MRFLDEQILSLIADDLLGRKSLLKEWQERVQEGQSSTSIYYYGEGFDRCYMRQPPIHFLGVRILAGCPDCTYHIGLLLSM